jgi:hypothetical protein
LVTQKGLFVIDEDVDHKLFGVVVVLRDGPRPAFEMGQDLVPETLIVKGLSQIRMSPQDFSFEAEYLFFHSLPSWR